jgi:hypothetical protein
MTDSEKLDELLMILKRVEARQIKTTAMVSEIEEAELSCSEEAQIAR